MKNRDCVLVVGGAGYIGSQAVADLAAAGFNPIIVDNFSTGNRDLANLLGVEIVEGDIADTSFLDKVFTKYKPSSVMHFAAFAYVGESVTDPSKYYRNNVGATIVLLDAMRRHGVGKFIFSSTCATHGIPERTPIVEDMPQAPINPYGRTKLMVEQILQDFDRAYGLKSIIFRYFNAAGAHPTLPIGERHNPETHLIPLAVFAAFGKGELQIFGTDYDTPDGTCIRDYIHIADISKAHILGLQYLAQHQISNVFNIGNGSGFSVREVIAAVEKSTGRKVPHTLASRRAGDPPRLIGGAEKIRKELGWKPEFPELQQIVDTAVAWHKKDLKLQ